MNKIIVTVGIILFLTGCASIQYTDKNTVLVDRNFGTMTDTFNLANNECKKTGRIAKLRSGSHWEHTNFYDCVNP
jgi:uncharacterized protein YceK